MVIERFVSGPGLVRERFERLGRQMPADIEYVDSWISSDGSTCYQLMRAETAEAMQHWMDKWSDLVEFEVIAVKQSADYWAGFSGV